MQVADNVEECGDQVATEFQRLKAFTHIRRGYIGHGLHMQTKWFAFYEAFVVELTGLSGFSKLIFNHHIMYC